MMSMAGSSSVDALPDPLSMIVQMISVVAEAISLGAQTRPATGSIKAKVVTGTSEIITVVASKTTTAVIDFVVLGSAVEV